MIKKIIFSSIILTLLVFAGPFGLEKGMTLEEIRKNCEIDSEIKNGYYELNTVPQPHPDFDKYIVGITQKSGLFYITAIGKEVTTNSYGIDLKNEFDYIESKIDSKYGEHNRHESSLDNGTWNEPDEWMMSLLKKERVLFTEWSRETGANLPETLESIGIVAFAYSPSKGGVHLEYYFSNYDSCTKELEEKEDSVF